MAYSGALRWLAAWAVLVGAAIVMRPLMPLDETRYLGVAWEMWTSGNLIVPHINGEPYSHKPPVLFWLINAAWAVFGPTEVVARLVAPTVGLACLGMTQVLARLWWPDRPEIAANAPWVLLGTLLFTVTTTLSMFDTLVALWTLVGLAGLSLMSRHVTGSWRRFVLGVVGFGVAIGLGVLSKGPVVAVFLLPAALLAFLWRRSPEDRHWGRWALGVVGGLVLAAVIALAWALPAAEAGGAAFERAIFWGQTSDRVAGGFSHARPFWWYLPVLFAVFFPWLLVPGLWAAVRRARWREDQGLRLLAVCVLGAIVVLSLFTDKQPHYLVPAASAFALIVARLASDPGRWQAGWLPMGLVAAIGLAASGLALWCVLIGPPRFAQSLPRESFWWLGALGAMALIVALLGRGRGDVVRALRRPALAIVTLVVAVHLTLAPVAAPLYDLETAAKKVAALQTDQRPVAYVGKYHNQFRFLGRLRAPLDTIDGDEVADWFGHHPGGVVIYLHRELSSTGPRPLFEQDFRSRTLAFWERDAALAEPGRFMR
ncbi:MAG: glycosyltransferase family 39 protein [Alphaproteobacteria bacterium]|nr:glycosyltransferase family 39 protein [Alphaproteobacteria bacterium]